MSSKEVKKYLNQSLLLFSGLTFIGLLVLILGTFFNILRDEMIGICFGFLPTGILGIILTLRSKDNPKIQKQIIVKTEERNKFIRYKAGSHSFWIFYIGIGVASLLSRYISLSLNTFLITMLLVMTIVYTSFRVICSKNN